MRSVVPVRLVGDGWAVATDGLRKSYKRTVALRGIDLTVPYGSVYVLVGPNGAGKTTALKILLDLARPDGGSVEALGMDPRRDGARLRAQIGYIPEAQKWEHAWMPVHRLIAHHARYFPSWDGEYAARLSRRLELPLDRPYGKLSKGQARRVQVVLALAHRPPLLVFDEPTDGLDPLVRETTLSVLAEHMAEHAATLLISTHLVHETERLADHMGVLQDGVLTAQATTGEIQRSLLRYRAEVPERWDGTSTLNGSVLRRVARGREIEWTVWGNEQEIRARLGDAGAQVREITRLSLEEAAVALLSPGGASHDQ